MISSRNDDVNTNTIAFYEGSTPRKRKYEGIKESNDRKQWMNHREWKTNKQENHRRMGRKN